MLQRQWRLLMVGDDGDDDDTDNDWWWWCSDNYGEIGDNFLQMQTAVVIGDWWWWWRLWWWWSTIICSNKIFLHPFYQMKNILISITQIYIWHVKNTKYLFWQMRNVRNVRRPGHMWSSSRWMSAKRFKMTMTMTTMMMTMMMMYEHEDSDGKDYNLK